MGKRACSDLLEVDRETIAKDAAVKRLMIGHADYYSNEPIKKHGLHLSFHDSPIKNTSLSFFHYETICQTSLSPAMQ